MHEKILNETLDLEKRTDEIRAQMRKVLAKKAAALEKGGRVVSIPSLKNLGPAR